LIASGGVVAVLLVGVASLLVYDQAQADQIAAGVRVDGVDVGGLDRAQARARLQLRVAQPLDRAVVVHAGARTFTLTPARAGVQVDVNRLVDQAISESRSGSILDRIQRDVGVQSLDARLPVRPSLSQDALDAFVSRIEQAVGVPARAATVVARPRGLVVRRDRPGVAVRRAALERELRYALTVRWAPHEFRAPLRDTVKGPTLQALRARYAAFIVVNRSTFKLKLYRHLRLAHVYPIAVGRQGLETPAGLYDVQWKQVDPPWHVPNSAWAGALAGRTIPPGPLDPIKARWLAFNGGAGIHGTDETSSIGHAASHGCIRMLIPDVIQLYSLTPVHSPVYVA
jgi:lipoprotein-anchoring transpeptidase ErfK/SrfK